MDDPDLQRFLTSHAAHDDLVKWGFVTVVTRGNYPGGKPQWQVKDPPAIIEGIRTGQLVGMHAQLAAHMLVRCKPPRGTWVTHDVDELIELIRGGQALFTTG